MAFHAGIILTAILLSGIFMPLSVMAAKQRTVSFEQYVYEVVPGQSQSLRGLDASIKCPDGNTISGPLFGFDVQKEKSSVSGTWGLLAAPGAALGDAGGFQKVHVDGEKFKLKGSWEGLFGRNNAVICTGAPLPATIVIKGNCGVGVDVIFKASNGVKGSFKGDVKCN